MRLRTLKQKWIEAYTSDIAIYDKFKSYGIKGSESG